MRAPDWIARLAAAYVLSTTTRHDPALMGKFGCDSFFRINDPTQFGLAVAKQVDGIVAGLEGPCIYQTTKVIERDLGFLDLTPPEDRPDWKVDRASVAALIHAHSTHLPFLMKHATYQHQFEYRFVWIIKGDVAEHIDVVVPEAVRYCSGPDLFSP